MTVVTEHPPYRNSTTMAPVGLEDKFEVVKEVGDGSFGSVALARVRTAGSHVARRGTMVAIKTMKKTFDSFASCLELREVIFLRALPVHPHLVPALDIFLDPFSKKLHIAMEYMDGNLYQLMKARDHKQLDGKSVKSILVQILAGLDHIHAHNFFHRDIKPENILVSSSAPFEQPASSTFSRYSSLVTPPSTPPYYTIKLADFGLARETHSKQPYTTYVSTRWYRAPEVLLRAGTYSAPVDMWALGAMAVEIATLKPLFPGGNEVDQVWRVCEIMGSPGNWYNKSGMKVGGGEWREGTRLAQKLGFTFPKMAPHSLESILRPPHWPVELSQFVTWCLMWDPKARPTSQEALRHEYFADAVDPLRPKSSTAKIGRKHSDKSFKSKEGLDSPTLSTKSSWFRRSIIGGNGRDSPAPVLEQEEPNAAPAPDVQPAKVKAASKRATWANGAPMPILPSIRPVSPLSNAVTAQASSTGAHANGKGAARRPEDGKSSTTKKIGRQLSVNSNGNHYSDIHRQDAEKSLNGGSGLASPQKESFFAHLRKRARRLSGRNQASIPNDVEANPGAAAAGGSTSNRSSMVMDNPPAERSDGFADLDRALENVRHNLDSPAAPTAKDPHRRLSVPHPAEGSTTTTNQGNGTGPVASRTRRALQMSTRPTHRYETPEEEDELLHEALHSTTNAARRLGQQPSHKNLARDVSPQKEAGHTQYIRKMDMENLVHNNPYPTPSPSSKQNGVSFAPELGTPSKPGHHKSPVDQDNTVRQWPTPPYDDNHWASSATASIFAAGSALR